VRGPAYDWRAKRLRQQAQRTLVLALTRVRYLTSPYREALAQSLLSHTSNCRKKGLTIHTISNISTGPVCWSHDTRVSARYHSITACSGGANATPTEALLIDAVLLTWQNYYTFAVIYEQKTGQSFTLDDMEKWERILASKEARYLRAIETLARVRRLLKLPQVQMNVALDGGQQVNVQSGG
jgi:hypothetical protein